MYAKVKLPDGFVKGDCENCPLCAYHPSIDDTYDDDGYCNDDGFQDWDECLIKECTEDDPYSNVCGNKEYPQDDCPMEIGYDTLQEKVNAYKHDTGYDSMTSEERIRSSNKMIKELESLPKVECGDAVEAVKEVRYGE